VSGMGVFNNLVLYKQDVPQSSLSSIVPELASEWSWNVDGTVLTFQLRPDVIWHDGKPFTFADVKCTWDMLLGKISPGFRLNPRKTWYHNLREITTNGDNEAAFHLNRPQPAFIALLAAGVSPVYPCHVTPAEMRRSVRWARRSYCPATSRRCRLIAGVVALSANRRTRAASRR
jgi:peptide/nickel transport system substrate-binding protein